MEAGGKEAGKILPLGLVSESNPNQSSLEPEMNSGRRILRSIQKTNYSYHAVSY